MDTITEIELTIGRFKDIKAQLEDAYKTLERNYRDCRNELCLRCGSYKTAHLGSCDGCKWKDVG